MDLIDHLPRSVKGRCIADQLMRSATSVAANYRAACRARSKAEFVAKLAIVIEEADESLLWLQLVAEGRVLLDAALGGLLDEADQITAIMVATRKTACVNRSS
jgi:four helix bundle protein